MNGKDLLLIRFPPNLSSEKIGLDNRTTYGGQLVLLEI